MQSQVKEGKQRLNISSSDHTKFSHFHWEFSPSCVIIFLVRGLVQNGLVSIHIEFT